jgi:hypothetical protein
MNAELAGEASNLRARLGFQGAGSIRSLLIYILVIGVFGVFLPWEKGRDFLDPVILGAYACLGVVFAAPAATPGFEKSPTIQEALARVAISVFYGELVAGVMLVLAVTTVYVAHSGRIVVGPDLRSLVECAAFGLMLSWSVSTAAVWISITASPGTAKTAVRLVFVALLAAFYLRSGWLPTVALRGAGIALLGSILLFLVLRISVAGGSRKA